MTFKMTVVKAMWQTARFELSNKLSKVKATVKQFLSALFSQSNSPRRGSAIAALLLLTLSLTFAATTLTPDVAHAINYDRKNLRQQDFSGQDLTDNDYTRADMTESNLSGAKLMGVRMFTTHLDRANLEGADLTGATLDGATLTKANLKNTILEGAYVISADFRGAEIEGADFTDVLFDPRVNDMLCDIADGINPVTGRETRETLYCP